MPRPERPADGDYYERDRVELFSQGDLFRDVPLAYPSPAEELVVDEVASPFVVFERDEVSSVAGSLPVRVAGEAATAGPQGLM